MLKFFEAPALPTRETALKGRETPLDVPARHFVLDTPMTPPWSASTDSDFESAIFGMGCFWGAERKFWQVDLVHSTQVGYAGGMTSNPTYEEVCSGQTGHNEVVRVIFMPALISYAALLKIFWESHDPTQGMRQGNDVGTQYRSGIYTTTSAQEKAALEARDAYQKHLSEKGYDSITTEIYPAPEFYYAEAYHQQYLGKNPHGYCGMGGTGVACPIGVEA